MKKAISMMLAGVLTLGAVFSSSFSMAVSAESDAGSSVEKVIAFPGAEGGGMYSPGARGALEAGESMEIYHVTNLNDSGAGSFREAVSKGNRIVVFDVSGNIDLASNVNISKDNMTILGQTAPGDGICFRGNNIKVSGENVILRYLRFRVGNKLADGNYTKAQDGLEVTDNTKNLIIDHCSVSWGTDENLSAYAVKDVTIQWSIIAEALNQSVHDKGEHSYAAIWGGVNLSVHHNLIATHKSRNPKIGTSETVAMTSGYTDDQTLVDIRNNVIYNWGDKAGYGAENGAEVNIINNYYKPGPSTPDKKRARIFEFSPGNKYKENWSGKVYANGNYIDDDSTDPTAVSNAAAVNENNWQPELKTGIYPDSNNPTYVKLETPNETYIKDYPINTQTAHEAYESVIENVGARLPKLDIVDQRIIGNVINRTAPTGSAGSVGLLDSPTDGIPAEDAALYDDRGYPIWTSVSREASYDADGDGISDRWEDKMGLDKTNPNDSLNIGAGGYTWLEIFVEEELTKSSKDSETTPSVALNIENNKIKANETAKLSATSNLMSEGSSITKVEFYCNEKLVATQENSSGDSYIANVSGLPTGENFIVAKAYNSKGEYSYSNIEKLYVLGTESMIEWTPSDEGATFDGNDYILGTDSLTKLTKSVNGDFEFVGELSNISNEAKNALTGIMVGNIVIGKGYDENHKLVIKYGEDLNSLLTHNDSSCNLFKITKAGTSVTLYCAENFSSWTEINTYTLSDTELEIGAFVSSENYTVSKFKQLKLVTAENKTAPKIEITNITNNQIIGFNDEVVVKVIPDSKAKIMQIAVYLGNNIVNSVEYPNGIASEQTITIPMTFSNVAEGALKVMCFDENLGKAEDSVTVAVSADISPWNVCNISEDKNVTASYIYGTEDYTYKIHAPEGNISGTSDTYGYMYQQFKDDVRLYFRIRPQSSKNIGIMLKNDLDADGASYFFGVEPSESGTQYVLKARKAKGAAYETIKVFSDMTVDKYFIIAEKVGTNLNIYETSGSGATIYKTKNLITSIDTGFGDEYYMGFAATSGVPDIGWLAIESIKTNLNNSYEWNMNYGMDWGWQKQEANVLKPTWTDEEIAGNATGKLVFAPNENYSSERFLTHEYVIGNEISIESGFDILLSGEKTAFNAYLQTESGAKAYKVSFTQDGEICAGDTVIGTTSYSTSKWYKVKMVTTVGTRDTFDVTVTDGNGNIVAQKTDVPLTSIRSINNIQTKQPISQAFYLEPVAGLKSTYYLDNMYVNESIEASLQYYVNKINELNESEYTSKSWSAYKKYVEEGQAVLNNENATEAEIKTALENIKTAYDGLLLLVSEKLVESKFWNFSTESFNALGTFTDEKVIEGLTLNPGTSGFIVDGNKKTFSDGTSYTYRLKNNGGGSKLSKYFKFSVTGKTKIWMYATTTNSTDSKSVTMYDGTNETTLKLPAGQLTIAEFEYNGTTPTDIYLYSTTGANFYGIKYDMYETVYNDDDTDLILGDVDGNGKVEVNDAALTLKYVLTSSLDGVSQKGLTMMEVTGNNIVTAEDAACILNKALDSNFVFINEK